MRQQVLLLFAVVPFVAHAGFESNGLGARPIALSNAFVAIANNQWATYYNPAGLSRISVLQGAAFFVPGQFGLRELSTVSAAVTFPCGPVSAGVMMEQFGFELYRETGVSLAMGTSLGEGFAAGFAFNLNQITIDRYGRVTRITADAGALVDIREDLRLGFDWKNLTATTVGSNGETLPQVQTVGLCYEISAQSLICLETEKDIRFPFVVKFAYEQRFLGALDLRFGVSNNPDKFSFGLGVCVSGFEFSYAGYSHAQLGWTHQLEIAFQY